MKLNHILGIALFALPVLTGLSACTDELDYTPGEPANSNGHNVYFNAGEFSKVKMAENENSFTVTVSRDNPSAAQSIPLIVVNPNDSVYTVPSTVEFAAGESTATLTITTSDKMRLFQTYFLSIRIPEEYTDPYTESENNPTIVVNVIKEDFHPYAEGLYTSEYFRSSWPMVLEYSAIQNRYRFSDLWEAGYDVTFQWNQGAPKMSAAAFQTGYMHPTYGMVSANVLGTDYDADNQTLCFRYNWTVAAGSFGEKKETFEITKLY